MVSDPMTVAEVLLFSYSESVFLKRVRFGGSFGNEYFALWQECCWCCSVHRTSGKHLQC